MIRADGGRKGLSLYSLIVSSFFLLAGLLLLFVAMMLLPRFTKTLETNAVERTGETVLQSTGRLELFVNNMLDTLHFVGGLLPMEPDADGDGYQAQIAFLQKSQPDVRNIAFFSGDGRLFYATGGSLAVSPQEVAASDWFVKALEWQGTVPFFSAPHVQHIFSGQHEWVVTLAKAVEYRVDGRIRSGVLLMDYDFSSVAELAAGVTLGSSGYVYLLDTADQIIYHPRQQLLYAGLESEDVSAVARQSVGICRDEIQGRERVLIINTVNQTRWRMVGVAYIDEILRIQSAFVRMMTIALICGGLLSIAAASVTAYYVTLPIRRLQTELLSVEAGNLNTVIEEGGFREIRALSASFNRMLWRIRQLMDQIVAEQEAKRFHELNALQAQINPHFLYNTMDSIIWMEERGHSREAITMVSALARLFRISISKGRNIISVREEMEHVRNYLIIQKMRFRNKFIYDIEAQPETLDMRTIKLIVQPLVENAVHHAIDAYDERTLHIHVTAKREEDLLVFTVSDDGVGIPEGKLRAILTEPAGKSGIGLKNVHERIQLTCGTDYGLSIESEEDKGTLVTIRLPVKLEGEA